MNRIGHIIPTDLADHYLKSDKLEDAEAEIRQQIRDTASFAGKDSKIATFLIAELSTVLNAQGNWREAGELEVQVITTLKRVLGAENPDTLTCMFNLALTYRNQGRWKEAEELFMQVMKTSLRVLGAEHPSTLRNTANLASTYRDQGRWKEAEELDVQVMETRTRVLGPEHPSTLTSISNLASTYWNQGRWKEAEELFVQVMETRKMMMMMMIFIYVRQVPSYAECPETSRRVRGCAKLWSYSTEVVTLESISCKKQARRQVTMFLPRPVGVEIE